MYIIKSAIIILNILFIGTLIGEMIKKKKDFTVNLIVLTLFIANILILIFDL